MHLRTIPSQKRRLSIAVFMRPDSAALNMGYMQMQPQVELFGWLRLRIGVFLYYRCADVYFHSFVRACLSIFACLS